MSDNSINIQELTEKIANQIKNSSNKDSSKDIDENNFEKLIELERLNKKMNREKENTNSEIVITSNFKKCLKEPFIIFILFILLSHTNFTNLITNIPIACIKDNQILQIIIKGMIMSFLFFFTKTLLD
jgi:hypothetical protein